MDAAKVAQTAELIGVEASIGTQHSLEIGHATKDFVAGAFSGMIGIASGQPLDTLRVRLQQRGCQQTSAAGVWHAMAGKEGLRGLFRGMSYPIYTTALQNAVTFQAQGAASRVLTGTVNRSSTVSWQHTCLAGMFAGAVQTCISCPVELLKIRLQLQQALPGTPGYVGPLGMLRKVVGQEGVGGLSSGFGVTLLRDIPSYGLYFCTYHWMMQALGYIVYSLWPQAAGTAQQIVAAQAYQHNQQVQQLLQSPEQQQQHQWQEQLPRQYQEQQKQQDAWQWHNAAQQEQQTAKQQVEQQPPPQQQQLQQRQLYHSIQQQDSAAEGHSTQHHQPQPAHQQWPQQQQQVETKPQWSASDPLIQFLAGGSAGALAWASVYPIDVIKSRVQAQPAALNPYSTAWQCAVTSWHEEGAHVFMKGLGATMGRGFIVNAAIFASFEALMKVMADH